MRLLECRIRGFKSFADPLILDFGEGLSAIVGPNGSGKSNVLDAIKWVLGEQSTRSLRAGRMEDVIFAGSSTRSPLGMAQVSLVIDNSDGTLLTDYREVVITRRLFRSGQSEYLLNGKPCRLKDITNIFLNTGLSKNAYAFIEQGQIENILSCRPEELRTLFEEAAGISRYKTRKDETLTKLAHTKANLTRVEDIVSELERDLPELKQRADQADRFTALEARRREYERILLESNYLRRRSALESSRQVLAGLDNRITELEAVLQGYRVEHQQLELELTQSEEQLQQDERTCARLEPLLAKYEERLSAVTRALQETEQSKAALLQEVHTLEEEFKALEKRMLEHQEQALQLEKSHATALEELKESRQQLAALQGNLDEVDWQALDRQGRELEVRARMVEREIADLRQQQTALDDEIVQQENQVQELEYVVVERCEASRALTEEYSRISRQLEDTKKRRDKLIRQLTECNEQLNRNKDRQQSAWREYHRINSEHDTLRKLVENYQGYRLGVRLLLEARNNGEPSCQGIIGTIADLIQVPAQLRTAITAVLGGSIEHIVTRDTAGAIAAIEYLKHHRGGRTTFLPLDRVSGSRYQLDQVLSQDSQVIGLASDLIEFDSKLKPVIWRLLGRVLVVKDTHTAVRLSKHSKLRVKMVTLSGEVFDPSGSITAGENRYLRTDLLSRSDELNKLQSKLSDRKQEIQQLESYDQILTTTRERLEGELSELEEQIQNLSQQLIELEKKSAQLEFEIEKYQEQLTNTRRLIDQGSRRRDEIAHKLSKLLEEVQQIETLQKEWQQRTGHLQVERRTVSDLLQTQTELEVAAARLEEQLRYCRERAAQEQNQCNRLSLQLEKLNQRLTALEAEREDFGNKRDGILTQVQEAEQQLLSAKRQLQNTRQQRQGVLAKIAKLDERKQLAERESQRAARKREQCLVEQARLEVELRQTEVELLRQAGISDPSTVSGRELTSKQEERVREEIALLEEEIAALGEVDLSAVAEYQRRSERIEHLVKQKTDLQQAQQKLVDIIAEIDQICAQRLRDTIELVNESFQQVFAELFQGGSATLHITEPDNILESGVEVQACPPGKKLQRLSLLSGGEKALTAIALLFAIFRVKPAPFCVLDEIDAALDETNNVRLAEYLKRFAAETQFIVITHSKYTMMAADRLYGITMQEHGVSTMVSMELE